MITLQLCRNRDRSGYTVCLYVVLMLTALGGLAAPTTAEDFDWLDDGSFLVILENGAFAGRDSGFGGHPAVLVVDIPEQERR